MSDDPVLVIQLQRLGDLILTFPLLIDLKLRYPGNPVWVAAEPQFFSQLMPLAPEATFFPPAQLPMLAKRRFKAVFNLSSREDGAKCAASCEAEEKYGLLLNDGILAESGFWQLYRLALTHNNRHNTFHWADLNRLDLGFPFRRIQSERQPKHRSGHVGLFTGASEPAKQPSAQFWVELANRLAARGHAPVLLGGPSEKSLGAFIAARAKNIAANFCGKTTLAQLAGLMKNLDLIIAPDTGPMHLADWVGAPVLNLSMGNVQPRETGPVSPGQWVVQSAISCHGCWQCKQPSLLCHHSFSPAAAARLASAIIGKTDTPVLPGLRLFKTARDALGLHHLEKADSAPATASDLLDGFWHEAFLKFSGLDNLPALAASASLIKDQFPALADRMAKNTAAMIQAFAKNRARALPENFWLDQPRHSRLFAGFIQMHLQNSNYAPPAANAALEMLMTVKNTFAKS